MRDTKRNRTPRKPVDRCAAVHAGVLKDSVQRLGRRDSRRIDTGEAVSARARGDRTTSGIAREVAGAQRNARQRATRSDSRAAQG